MSRRNGLNLILLWTIVALVASPVLVAVCAGGDEAPDRQKLREPVFRVATRASEPEKKPTVPASNPAEQPDTHPLDPALDLARNTLAKIQAEIRDYTCTIVKQERINGVVLDPEYMNAKVRNRQVDGNRTVVPFSVYMKFVKPASVKGREVIYVENRNDGKMVAHEGGVKGKFLPTVWIKTDGILAMRNQRYPITEIGIVTLAERLIERGELDRRYPDCKVEFFRNAKLNGRNCTCLQVLHPNRRPDFDFYLARIFIDDEMGVPVRYVAYDWPTPGASQPQLIESYTYLNMKLNVGLTDADFDHENSNYNF